MVDSQEGKKDYKPTVPVRYKSTDQELLIPYRN